MIQIIEIQQIILITILTFLKIAMLKLLQKASISKKLAHSHIHDPPTPLLNTRDIKTPS